MTDLDALLAGIVAHPHEVVRWLIVADWLDDHGFADRAELLRLHRMLIDTCCEPDLHPDRAAWQARIVELIDQGVKPCVPQHTLVLPGGVPLVGNFIPPGSFLMGSDDFNTNRLRQVTVPSGFFLGATPVTQEQWRAVMGTDPSHFKGDNQPVERVNWSEAITFCDRTSQIFGQGVRLPSEAEWEYACRAAATTAFHFGEVAHPDRMNYDASETWNGSTVGIGREQTTDSFQFAPNAWGLFDLHGNVFEWCLDEYGEVELINDGSPQYVPSSPGDIRVMRGGAWSSGSQECQAGIRCGGVATDHSLCDGFRVAFTLS